MAPMVVNKNDSEARATFGQAYDALPKSVLAMAAYWLARRVHGDSHGDAIAGLRQEILSLGANGIITDAQTKRADNALIADAVCGILRDER